MGQVKLGRILENAARLSGRLVGTMGVTENQRALAAMAMSEGIRKIAAEKFPMMMRVEFRRYRPTWTGNAGWTLGMECWYGTQYWRLEAAASTGAPGTEGSGWRELAPKEIAAFISFEQPWENTIIDRGGVDLNHFAYCEDPKYHPAASPAKGCKLTAIGISIPVEEEQARKMGGLWCRFVPKYPNASFVEWDSHAAYEGGDVAYSSTTKDMYQCVEAVTPSVSGNVPPADDAEHWQAVRISDEFETYLTRLLAADFLTEDQGKYQTKASADREFEELCARFAEGIGDGRMRTGRFR